MKRRKPSGFTLIELLVVIAIIGILSSIVLSSLSYSRAKAADSGIRQQINELRSAAEITYSANGNYDTICDPDTNGGKIFRAAFDLSDKTAGSALCVSSGSTQYKVVSPGVLSAAQKQTYATHRNEWVSYVKLPTGGYYCVDFNNAGTTTASAPAINVEGSPAVWNSSCP